MILYVELYICFVKVERYLWRTFLEFLITIPNLASVVIKPDARNFRFPKLYLQQAALHDFVCVFFLYKIIIISVPSVDSRQRVKTTIVSHSRKPCLESRQRRLYQSSVANQSPVNIKALIL